MLVAQVFRILIISLVVILVMDFMAGCLPDPLSPPDEADWPGVIPRSGETRVFREGDGSGYYGPATVSCNRQIADSECRDMGFVRAVDWACRTQWVMGFMGAWYEAEVMYCITCWRPSGD